MKKTAFIIMIITILSKFMGFTRDIFLSYFYGTSNLSDAYLISLTIPGFVFSFIGLGVSTGYTPMYSKIEKENGFIEGIKFTNNLINILIIISTIILILGIIFSEPIVKLFASGFEGSTLSLTIKFTRISLISIYFTGLIYIYSGFLQIKGNFVIPAFIGIPLNIVIIISIILSSTNNVLILSVGYVLATISQLLFLIPSLNKLGYKYEFALNLKNQHINKMFILVIPVIIGVSVDQINMLIDRTLASSIAVGGISALNYANKLNLFIQGIIVTSIVTAIYPSICQKAISKDYNGLKQMVSETMNIINLLIIPITIGTMIFSEPIIKLLFGRGAFDNNAIFMTSNSLYYYSIGMIGFGLREVLSRAFYSIHDTKTPMINASLSMSLNIILNLILSKRMGITGLALATSISAIFCTVLLLINYRIKFGAFGLKNLSIAFSKILIASIIMGLIAKFYYNIIIQTYSNNFTLITSMCVGCVVYFILIYIMKIEDAHSLSKLITSVLRRTD